MAPQSQVTIFVCVSCRQEKDADARPGLALADALREKLSGSRESKIAVEPVECLAVCKRPCTIALAGEGKWTYVVGDLDKDTDLDGIIASAHGFAASDNGVVAWKDRPDCFKKGVVSRAPPPGPTPDAE
jgi:predicted metal-binding protein